MTTATTTQTERLSQRELAAWAGLLRAHASLKRELDADLEAAHGLPLTSFEVLMYVADAENQRMRMSDLADRVLLSRSGLTRLVDRLVAQGLIERASCSSDARGSHAVLTPAGAERLCAARATHLAGVRERFLARLTPEEQELLAGVWRKLIVPHADDSDICSSINDKT
jgi:DNA-binding MarR family transcriptional regulator